jgi:hypothetical protein
MSHQMRFSFPSFSSIKKFLIAPGSAFFLAQASTVFAQEQATPTPPPVQSPADANTSNSSSRLPDNHDLAIFRFVRTEKVPEAGVIFSEPANIAVRVKANELIGIFYDVVNSKAVVITCSLIPHFRRVSMEQRIINHNDAPMVRLFENTEMELQRGSFAMNCPPEPTT